MCWHPNHGRCCFACGQQGAQRLHPRLVLAVQLMPHFIHADAKAATCDRRQDSYCPSCMVDACHSILHMLPPAALLTHAPSSSRHNASLLTCDGHAGRLLLAPCMQQHQASTTPAPKERSTQCSRCCRYFNNSYMHQRQGQRQVCPPMRSVLANCC